MSTLSLSDFQIFKLNLLNKTNVLPLAEIPVVLASARAEADLLLSRSLQIFEGNP